MGQTALGTTLNELKHVLLLQIFFAGHIIYDIGGICQIAPPNFTNILTIVQSDVRGGSKNLGETNNASTNRTHTPVCFQVGPSS